MILPKHLLTAATSGRHDDYHHLLRDNYETPFYAPELAGSEFELQQLEMILKLSVDDFKAHAQTLSSPDELSVYIAHQLMRQVAPSLLWITMHDIDIAHAGAYSLYIEGIRRTDRLCSDLWKAIQSEPEYAGKTTLFILPDFGRDSDDDSGGNGFQHHRTGDAALPDNLDVGGRPGHSRGSHAGSSRWSRPTWCPRSERCSDSLHHLAQGRPIDELL